MAKAERDSVGVGSSFELEGFWYESETSTDDAVQDASDACTDVDEPEHSQRLAHGTLSYTPEAGATLTVVDLHPGPPGLSDHPLQMETLHGHTLAGQPLTVFDLTLRDRSGQLFGGHTREVWHSNTLIYGAHLHSLEELEIERVSVEISGLREWISENIYEQSVDADDDRRTGFVDRLRRLETWLRSLLRRRHADEEDLSQLRSRTETVEISPEATLELRLAENGTSTRFSDSKEVEGWAFFRLDPTTGLPAFEKLYAQPLLDLLALATKSTAQIEDITVHVSETLDIWWEPGKSVPWSRQIKVVHRLHGPPAEAPRERTGRMLLPLAALKHDDHAAICRWFAFRRRLAGVGDLFFATINGRVIYLENRVHNLLAVAEGLHRALYDARPIDDETHRRSVEAMMEALPTKNLRQHYRGKLKFAYEQTQRQRIRQLFERAAEALPEAEGWRRQHLHQLIETRNYLNHQGEKSEDVLENDRLWLATSRLQIVLEICLLQEIEIESDQVSSGVWRAYGQHPALTDQLG